MDTWLRARGIEGDFTVADTVLLNRYFREYYLEHGQSGTHTLQRNFTLGDANISSSAISYRSQSDLDADEATLHSPKLSPASSN